MLSYQEASCYVSPARVNQHDEYRRENPVTQSD